MAETSLTDPLRETLAVFGASAPGTPLTTTEVADHLAIGRRSTYSRLERLADRDLVETKKVGARGRVWWRPPEDASTDAERRAWTEGELHGSLMDAVEEYAIFTLDADGRVRTWNDGAARIKGYDGRDVVGEHVSTFYTEADREAGVPDEHLATAEVEGSFEDEGWRVRDDGSRFWARATISAIRNDRGELAGFAKVTRDLTDRRANERALRREHDTLDRSVETSPIAIGVFDAGGEATQVDERFADLVGTDDASAYALGDRPILDEAGEVVPPEERPAQVAIRTGRPVTDERLRVEGTDGVTRRLSVNATPLEGDTAGVVVAMADVNPIEEQARLLERQRDEIEAELQHVFDRIDDAFWALDDEYRFTYINDHAAELLDRSPVELVGANVWEALPWLSDQLAEEKFEEAMATGRTVQYEDFLEQTARWYDVRVYPSESGLSVYYQDVTERKRRERELEESRNRYRALVENFPNGAVTLVDRDLRYTTVGGTPIDEADATVADLEGSRLRDRLPPELVDLLVPRYVDALEGEQSEFEGQIGDRDYQFQILPVRNDDEVFAALGMSQDVTELKARERELERYETIVETVDDGIYALDEDANFVLVNDAYCELVGRDREALIGQDATVVHDDEIGRRAERLASEVAAGERELATIEYDLGVEGRPTIPVETRLAPYPIGDGHGRCGVVRDVTERIERQRELERYVGIVDAVGEPVYELDERGHFTFVNDAMVERSGYPESKLLGAHVSIGMDDETVDRVVDHVADLLADGDEGRTTVEYEVVTKDGERIPTENRIYLRTDEAGRFTGSAGMLWDVSERVERQRELERQRNRLEALNDLNDVVREITDAVIDQSTREEIERIVCARLAESDSYVFAWIGDVDGQSGTVNLRAEAGVEGYLEGLTISVDADDERSRGPTGRALIEREAQISRDVENDPSHDPWRGEVEEYGFRSWAAIPILHEGTLFGVLNVYADRPHAFDDDEQAVIGQLGEVVGHAIAAVERKQALMSDEVVEIEFQIQDVFEGTGVPPPADGTITLDRAVSIGDGTFLVYGTATGDASGTIDAMVDSPALDHLESMSVLAAGDGDVRFELRMEEPPVFSTVASHGGYVHEATMEGGDYYMRVHLAPGTDVRQIADSVQEAYPTTVLVTRQQVTRRPPAMASPDGSPLAELTDRQRTAIETAFYAGYFGWPRDSSGGDLAESLGIDPSTFHYHLREAQRKLLGSVLATNE